MYMFAGGTRADKSKRDNYIILRITRMAFRGFDEHGYLRFSWSLLNE